ncbi:MAG: signal peptide peptidase SppA [candidate division Zixibacteria bacterium]|nr:signal peptide peptidase SppA [candidate division Zixibacteria bacterium]
MKKGELFIAVVIGGSVLFFLLLMLLTLVGVFQNSSGLALSGDRIGHIRVTGVISSSNEIVSQVKRYAGDKSIPVILLDINSPGGGVAASQEIYEELVKARAEGKKVVASMRSVAASGGYYIACAADTIVANSGTITGSIGVIFEFPVVEELLRKVGVKFEVVKSGELKDVGSTWRDMKPQERQMLQNLIDDAYQQFVEVIIKERGLTRREVLRLADGSVFTGRMAKNLKLVDELGTFEDAVLIAAEMAGIKGEPRLIRERPKRPVSVWDVLGQAAESINPLSDNERFFPKLEYRYR